MNALVRSLDEGQVAPTAAAESMVTAVSSIAGLLISQRLHDEASRVWLHVLVFQPFLREHGSDCSVGTLLQQAHNVFESAAAQEPRPHGSPVWQELEFDSSLLAAVLQASCAGQYIRSSSASKENTGVAMNLLPALQQWAAASCVAVDGSECPGVQIPQAERCCSATSKILPDPSSRMDAGSDTDCQHGVQDGHMLPESATAGTSVRVSIDTDSCLRSPLLDMSPRLQRECGEVDRACRRGAGRPYTITAGPGCYTPELSSAGLNARYDGWSSDEPNSPTFRPATDLSMEATPSLWGVPMVKTAVSYATVLEECLDTIESPVCNMSRLSAATLEGSLFSECAGAPLTSQGPCKQ